MNDERRDDSRTENDELRLVVLDASNVLQWLRPLIWATFRV
jgi:hypothetical protein